MSKNIDELAKDTKNLSLRQLTCAIILKKEKIHWEGSGNKNYVVKNYTPRWQYGISTASAMLLISIMIDCVKALGYRFTGMSLPLTYIICFTILTQLCITCFFHLVIRLIHLKILIHKAIKSMK